MKDSAAFRLAAEIIRTRGLAKGELYQGDPYQGPCCTLGALRAALGGHPAGCHTDLLCQVADMECEIQNHLERHRSIANWNDDPETTQEDVINLLESCARIKTQHGE